MVLIGAAYTIDQNRMASGKNAIFSLWGSKDVSNNNGNISSDGVNYKDAQENSDPVKVTLYFPDMNVMNLFAEERIFETDTDIEKQVVEAIISGPVNEELLPSVTDNVKVNSAQILKGTSICEVDLSSEFAKYNTGGTAVETMAIYSIVNSLCNLEGITEVKINIDGNSKAHFGGHYDITEPIEADMTLVKS